MSRDEIPLKEVEIWPTLKQYAEAHSLKIDYHFRHKVKWMEAHGAVCFCAHKSNRRCPCGHIREDLKQYNGSCLCGVLNTPEALLRALKYRGKKKLWIRLPADIVISEGIVYNLDEFKKERKNK